MSKQEFHCVICGLNKNAITWEHWLKKLWNTENERDQTIHIVRVMKPLVDTFADHYFEPKTGRGVCGFCEAGGSYYNPDRHADDCPAFVAWQIKPMVDQLLKGDNNGTTANVNKE